MRARAAELGFSLVDQTKIVTAASELARNTLEHGGGGTVLRSTLLEEGGRRGLRLTFEDRGPGIADIGLALTDGYYHGRRAWAGPERIAAARRTSSTCGRRPGEGTRVTVVRWK